MLQGTGMFGPLRPGDMRQLRMLRQLCGEGAQEEANYLLQYVLLQLGVLRRKGEPIVLIEVEDS